MLNKSYRITTKDFAKIFRKAKRIPSENFDLKVFFDNRLPKAKFAVVVSKKIDKRATVRNLIRRKTRAAIYKLTKESSIKPAYYIILTKNKEFATMGIAQIAEILRKTL